MDNQPLAAFGGPGWSPRTSSLSQEIGGIWAGYSVASEFSTLEAVLLHRPGRELHEILDPNRVQMIAKPHPDELARQHDGLAEAYRAQGVAVHYVEPPTVPPPNQMFVADLLFTTTSGVILGRPASTVRAGEERWVARRLADLGIPILRSVAGNGTFEGADAMWLDEETVLIGRGLRTNLEGALQVADALDEIGIVPIIVDLPQSAMHLMGSVRIVDRDLAYVRSGDLPWTAIEALGKTGYEVNILPDNEEIASRMAHNFVTLAPRKILMPEGNPLTEGTLNEAGITTVTVNVDEITKAAGGIGCLSGVLARDR